MRTFLGTEDILTGPPNFKGQFKGLDMVLKLRLELRLGWGQD